MKEMFFATAMTSAFASQAQIWCPPGAEFWFEHLSAGQAGYVHAAYVGDTLIDGETAQRLEQYVTGYDFWAELPYYYQRPPVITRQVAGQVSYQEGGAWHILFDLDLPPGGQWSMTELGFEEWVVQVLDTGHMVVGEVALRWSEVAFTPPFGPAITDTVIERAGFKNVFMEPWRTLLLDGDVIGLRCYSDEEMNYSTGLSGQCDFILGVSVPTEEPRGPCWPNPAQNLLWLDLDQVARGAHYLILDQAGRRIAGGDLNTNASRSCLDIGTLDAGLYTLRFESTGEPAWTARFVKE